MSEPTTDAQLRALVAGEHGLDADAARLLVGSTLSELEESAAALGKLLGERREPKPAAAAPPNLFTAAAAAKLERKQALVNALTGRPPQQPRDQQGRFTGFDGGARRQSAPPRAETHEQTLLKILSSRAADLGVRL